MANRSDPLSREVHGTNPQRLIEKILRTKIYNCTYWKEQCFGLTAESLVDRAMELTYIGGTYGGLRKPTKFMCLLMKMLQIQPEPEIVLEFVKCETHKYARCLGALYLRCTARPQQVYNYLEPLYADYSKLRYRAYDGWSLVHVDEFAHELLTSDYSCDVALPHLPKRYHLEAQHLLEPRQCLVEESDEEESDEKRDEKRPRKKKKTDSKKKAMDSLFKKKTTPEEGEEVTTYNNDDDGGNYKKKDDGLDVEATNALRRKLGLKPLRGV